MVRFSGCYGIIFNLAKLTINSAYLQFSIELSTYNIWTHGLRMALSQRCQNIPRLFKVHVRFALFK
jgi:hypothetical protein